MTMTRCRAQRPPYLNMSRWRAVSWGCTSSQSSESSQPTIEYHRQVWFDRGFVHYLINSLIVSAVHDQLRSGGT